MGAEASQGQIVDLEKETKNRTIQPWKEENRFINDADHGTMPIDDAFPIIQDIFNTFEKPINILEVGSGNGFQTQTIAKMNNVASLKATDINDYIKKFYEVQVESSDEAVKNYVGDMDLLLLVCPPPNEVYMDYYAIKEYELKQQTAPKYLIFVGELGAGDGTTGIYQYLTNELEKLSDWQLISRKLFSYNPTFSAKKEVWFFKY